MTYYDQNEFVYGFSNLAKGNHVATVVTYEPTGNFNVQRLAGLFTNTNVGAGFGDMNGNGADSSRTIFRELLARTPLKMFSTAKGPSSGLNSM